MLRRDELDRLLDAIRRRGFRLVGPVLKDGAIIYGDISSAADLPAGWTDEQDAGTYRVRRRDDQALFGYNVGPQSWKKYLFPAVARLGVPDAGAPEPERFAFIGVRACELRAIAIQDRVFTGGRHADPGYAANREGAFLVAVNCGQAAKTCFCTSMSAGPKAEAGFDLALTELLDSGGHRFLVEAGTARGAEVLAEDTEGRRRPPRRPTSPPRTRSSERTAAAMERSMPAIDLRDLLYDNLEHPRWDDVASRCLACGNCTMVCPTCFCFSVEEVTGLAGADDGAAAVVGLVLHARPLLPARRPGADLDQVQVPPVDDAQAGYLAGPVRHLRVRGMRALHRVVPGRDRHHRGGRRNCSRRLSTCLAATGSSTGWTRSTWR